MKIICKTTLYPPPPPFVGSRLRLGIAEDGQSVTLYSLTPAEGCESVTVDWADGTVEQFSGAAAHTYAKAGVYEVKISDDVAIFRVAGVEGFDSNTVLSFISNATQLHTLQQFCFSGCANLTEVNVRESGLLKLNRCCFENCTGLSGELYFPTVNGLVGTASRQPFGGCTGGITKIHFAVANEEAIRASAQYQADPTLGSGTAEVVFDL